MNRYKQIGAILTVAVAIAGVLTATNTVSYVVPAVIGVVCGLWWAFGKVFMADEVRADRADRDASRAARDARRGA